jgi:hypothetical protein
MKTSPDDPVIFNGKNTEFNGLTKRELFAAIICSGLCASPDDEATESQTEDEEGEPEERSDEDCCDMCAEKAVMQADALIRALNK